MVRSVSRHLCQRSCRASQAARRHCARGPRAQRNPNGARAAPVARRGRDGALRAALPGGPAHRNARGSGPAAWPPAAAAARAVQPPPRCRDEGWRSDRPAAQGRLAHAAACAAGRPRSSISRQAASRSNGVLPRPQISGGSTRARVAQPAATLAGAGDAGARKTGRRPGSSALSRAAPGSTTAQRKRPSHRLPRRRADG